MRHGTLEINIQDVLWSKRGPNRQYEVPILRMSNDLLKLDQIQRHSPPIRFYTTFTLRDIDTTLGRLPNNERLALNSCDGCGIPTKMLTPPDTLSHLILDLHVINLLIGLACNQFVDRTCM